MTDVASDLRLRLDLARHKWVPVDSDMVLWDSIGHKGIKVGMAKCYVMSLDYIVL